jgi:AcrR family transcriptional regulator
MADMPASPPGPSPRPGGRRRRSAAQRRDLILRAAAGVFAEQGYHGASMTAIAAAAGIAPSVIYDHFPSKKDLHLELLTLHARAMVEATTRVPAGGSGEEVVRRSTDAFFAYVEQNRFAWRMLFRDPPADEQTAAIHADIHQRGTAAIATLIHLAPALRLPPGIPRERADEMIARAVKSANDGLAAWWYEHPEVPRDQVVAVAAGLAWNGLARLASPLPDHHR